MSKIDAFVSHSFNHKDDNLVKQFLDMLDTIKRIIPDFNWIHAKPAEPSEIADKIMRHMKDKNLLIALCTNHENVIDSSGIKNFWFSKKKNLINKSLIETKASDWVIQEIGYFIGKEVPIILLLEDQIRTPGGLQGNIEHIRFNRNNLSNSYTQLLEMISSKQVGLIPIAQNQQQAETRIEKNLNNIPEVDHSISENAQSVEDEWKFGKYFVELVAATKSDNLDRLREIWDKFNKSQFNNEEDTRIALETLVIANTTEAQVALNKFLTLIKKYPDKSYIYYHAGSQYLSLGEAVFALEYIEKAAHLETSPSTKLKWYGEAAITANKLKLLDKRDYLLVTVKNMSNNVENGEQLYFNVLTSIYNENEQEQEYCAIAEKILEIVPLDDILRFKLAYKYSKLNLHNLSYLHYSKIVQHATTDSGVYNNLGIESNSLNLKYYAIKNYRKAEELESTIAMSNIADILISDGFLDEAEQLCNKALQLSNYNSHILNSLKTINDNKEAQLEQERKILDIAQRSQAFYLKYGKSILKESVGQIKESWQFPNYSLQINIYNNIISGKGSYTKNSSAISQLLSPQTSDFLNPKHLIVELSGEVLGRGIKYSLIEYKELIKQFPERSVKGLMIMNDDETSMDIMEIDSTSEPNYITIKRL